MLVMSMQRVKRTKRNWITVSRLASAVNIHIQARVFPAFDTENDPEHFFNVAELPSAPYAMCCCCVLYQAVVSEQRTHML